MTERRVQIDNHALRLSNLDKVLYPESGFTKAQVIAYYSDIAEIMLPHLANRPLSLRRWPNGVAGHSFFEKNCPGHRPQWVRTSTLPSSSGKADTINFCIAQDRATLLWLANLAALELHAYLHRVDAPETPTHLVFDLDPGEGASFSLCAQVAQRLRDRLADHSLDCWAKVSGGKGIHVYVPLNTDATYTETRTYARTVAGMLVREDAEHTIDRMNKAARTGKVFIDWSQNASHKTTVAVYSLRGRAKPTVSVPVQWEEIERWSRSRQSPPQFLPDDALQRVASYGDLFAPLLTTHQSLPEAVTASR